jgi:hypothetical protein
LFLTPFEQQQQRFLNELIDNALSSSFPHKGLSGTVSQVVADRTFNSFNLSENGHSKSPVPSDPKDFSRSSVEDINTTFVKDGNSSEWQFNAGSSQPSPDPSGRSQSAQRSGRSSPLKHTTTTRADAPEESEENKLSGDKKFNADGWEFGPQTFVPQVQAKPSGSPSRPNRTGSRTSKTSKGAATPVVNLVSDDSDDDAFTWRGRKGPQDAAQMESPQAMDIDSPPSGSIAEPSSSDIPRNIPVEPSRPEWRPGDFNGAGTSNNPIAINAEPVQAKPNAGGSEDSEEFKASFSDLKNVAPFAQQGTGLKSLNELKDNLPFDSKPSDKPPIDRSSNPQPLKFPAAPTAPRLPPTMAISGMKPTMPSWNKYAEEFDVYLRNWDTFNGLVVDHFATRRKNLDAKRQDEGYGFLHTRSSAECLEYLKSVQQDNDVRTKWNHACEEHAKRLQEFLAFKEKMS